VYRPQYQPHAKRGLYHLISPLPPGTEFPLDLILAVVRFIRFLLYSIRQLLSEFSIFYFFGEVVKNFLVIVFVSLDQKLYPRDVSLNPGV